MVRSAALREQGFELGEGLLDRVEVGAVGRQIEQLALRPPRLTARTPCALVAGSEIVHDDDVARACRSGTRTCSTRPRKAAAVDRSVENHRRDHAAQCAARRRRSWSSSVHDGTLTAQSFAFRRPAVAARHVGRGPGLVDEHQAVGLEVELGFEPGLAALHNVRAILLGRVRSLFLRVILWRRKKRQSVP